MADRTSDATSDIANPDLQKFFNFTSNDAIDLQKTFKESSKVDLTLSQASKKLANFEKLLLGISAMANNTIYFEDDQISAELVENSFRFDILTCVVNLELQELHNLTCDLQALVVDWLRKLSVSGQSTELLIELLRNLHDSEERINQTQERILEIKIQLSKMWMRSFPFKPSGWKSEIGTMEKFLTREVELEKKLVEFKQNEDDLKLKMRLTEQVAACMEVAAESAWERFMEADYTAEVLMGISKEMLGKLQILELNLSDSIKREEESKDKLQDCINQLNAKELSSNNLSRKVAVLMSDNTEVTNLRQKVKFLGAKLTESESQLKEADSLSKTCQLHVEEMESEIESLKAAIYASEIQVGGAEMKISHLEDANVELTEEVDFLKGSNDDNSKKLGLLEERLREYESQLQHSKASSEASQEQQTMLYTAIWDMETLIDELKQKVANGESRIKNKEAKCSELSETIAELNKEISFLRSRVEVAEMSLMQSSDERISMAKDISTRTNCIMDTVMEIAREREQIQKQLISLKMENKLLRLNFEKAEKLTHASTRISSIEEFLSSQLNRADAASSMATEASEILSTKLQANKPLEDASTSSSTHHIEKGSDHSTNHLAGTAQNPEVSLAATRNPRNMYAVMASLFVLLSIIASQLLPKKIAAPNHAF